MKKQKETIKCPKDLQEELQKEKLTPRESYEEIIRRILHSYRKIKWDVVYNE